MKEWMICGQFDRKINLFFFLRFNVKFIGLINSFVTWRAPCSFTSRRFDTRIARCGDFWTLYINTIHLLHNEPRLPTRKYNTHFAYVQYGVYISVMGTRPSDTVARAKTRLIKLVMCFSFDNIRENDRENRSRTYVRSNYFLYLFIRHLCGEYRKETLSRLDRDL